jgi:hypothetical protein
LFYEISDRAAAGRLIEAFNKSSGSSFYIQYDESSDFKMLSKLHTNSVLNLDGTTCEVTFPTAPGAEGFKQGIRMFTTGKL